ncbi:hypothetical protein AGMMS4957_14210 [Bacteroidia bacterium]|nr:hypothetical protein AGMMS4957_14210 [Bacteroidia bacterium]
MIQEKVSVPDGIAIADVKVIGTGDRILAKSAEYENGTLTVELLNPVPSEWLTLLDGVKVANARGAGFEAYDADGNHLGNFKCQNADGAVQFFYVESDATVVGCSLKKGWNKIFVDENTKKPSTTIPSDVKWVFIE